MNRSTFNTLATQGSTPRSGNKRMLLVVAAAMLAAIVPAIAQTGAGAGAELQQKVAAVKQSVAENQQKLHQYQWKETTQLTLKGDAKPPSQAACQYGPDGKVQKTPLGPPPAPPSGGRMKQKVIANKKEEMKDYMGQVKSPARQVRATRSAEHATGLPVRESLVESQCKFRRSADCIQGLCPGRRPDDDFFRHCSKKDQPQ